MGPGLKPLFLLADSPGLRPDFITSGAKAPLYLCVAAWLKPCPYDTSEFSAVSKAALMLSCLLRHSITAGTQNGAFRGDKTGDSTFTSQAAG
jgi:hypothetical protein